MSSNTIERLSKSGASFTLHLKMKTGEAESKHDSLQNELAGKSGLAIILADEHSSVLKKSNDNSMCEMLYDSPEFAPECAKFCGKAFEWATKAGEAVNYKCYAGLNCLAVPLKKDEKPLVAIVGRAFAGAEDYRRATERAIEGDWQNFPIDEFFENVLLTDSIENLEKLARQVGRLGDAKKKPNFKQQTSSRKDSAENEKRRGGEAQISQSANADSQSKHWRSLLESLLDMSYRQACFFVLKFVAERFSINHTAWLERQDNELKTLFANGILKDREIHLSIAADDERLLNALRTETPLELRERQTDKNVGQPLTIRLFPVAVGDEVKSGLVIIDALNDKSKQRQIAKFCRTIASELEILRLREKLSRREWLERAVEKFNENLKSIDSEDFWQHLSNTLAELLKAERSSLLVFDEKSDSFVVKAATGNRADFIQATRENLGERVARNVFSDGQPAVIEDIGDNGLPAAPNDWQYKSNSFISYPITIGERKIGVLNLTDRADGEAYSARDLEILDSLMPQLAVLIDRASLKHKAGKFEQLSVTDALTGLLNRRYLEERLIEEIKRSNRHDFPMSFAMIDVDEFKSYNDTFGHTEGDKALQIVGICLKELVRGADVAARYGGEEFSILLPQTNSEEAASIAERIRERIEKTKFPQRKVTVSIGVASLSLALNSTNDLINAADKALYEAKRRGRNNVQIYENLKK